MLEITNLTFTYSKNSQPVFQDLSLTFSPGFNIILGPNGAGKSTLVKSIFGLLDYKGQIKYKNLDLTNMPANERVKLMSYLPQMDINFSTLTVLEMVLLGRLPELTSKVSEKDLNIVMETLEAFSIQDLSSRRFSELSGGQQKLVFIAQTLVRQPQLIILDEPTNSLDLQKQLELCQILKNIVFERNIDLIVILHDINLSAQYADHLVVLDKKGTFYNSGKPKEVITSQMLRDVYGVIGDVTIDRDGIPIVSAKKSIRSF